MKKKNCPSYPTEFSLWMIHDGSSERAMNRSPRQMNPLRFPP